MYYKWRGPLCRYKSLWVSIEIMMYIIGLSLFGLALCRVKHDKCFAELRSHAGI